jgi:hypothetical protein
MKYLLVVLTFVSSLVYADTSLYESNQPSGECVVEQSLILDSKNTLYWNQSKVCDDTITSSNSVEFAGVSAKTWFYILNKAISEDEAEGELYNWDNQIVVSLGTGDLSGSIVVSDSESEMLAMSINIKNDAEGILSSLRSQFNNNLK